MREIRSSGSEGGGIETNRFSLPLSNRLALCSTLGVAGTGPATTPRVDFKKVFPLSPSG